MTKDTISLFVHSLVGTHCHANYGDELIIIALNLRRNAVYYKTYNGDSG